MLWIKLIKIIRGKLFPDKYLHPIPRGKLFLDMYLLPIPPVDSTAFVIVSRVGCLGVPVVIKGSCWCGGSDNGEEGVGEGEGRAEWV